MLPVELVKIICDNMDTHQEMLAYLSTANYFDSCKKQVCWNKKPVAPTTKIIQLPYYDNFSRITLTKEACYKLPKYLKELHFVSVFDSVTIAEHFFAQNLPYLTSLILYADNSEMLDGLLGKYEYINTLRLHNNNPGVIQNVKWHLAKNLETLEVYCGEYVRQEKLPKTLKRLVLGICFEIYSLPPSLQELEIKHGCDHLLLQGIFPTTLKKLCLGKNYNREIQECVLPEGLTELEFGKHFNQRILSGTFPSSIKKITFGEQFNQSIINLPEGVETIKVGLDFDEAHFLHKDVPSTLKEVYVPRESDGHVKQCKNFAIIGYNHPKYKDSTPPGIWESIHNLFVNTFSIKK